MATIWPYKRLECLEIPTLTFNTQTKVEPDGNNKVIVTEQDPALTEFMLSAHLPDSVSKYYGSHKETVKVDYCTVIINKETRTRLMQKLKADGSVLSTSDKIKTGHLKGLVEVDIFAVLAEDAASIADSSETPSSKGTILATWPKLFIHLDPPPDRTGDEFPTRWVAFSENENTSKYIKAIHYVDTDEDIVLINDDLPRDLKNILQGNEGGAYKALRDAIFSPVAVDICEQLARYALYDAREHDGIVYLGGHYKRLIESICTLLTGIDDQNDALEELNEIICDSDAARLNKIVSTILPLACQQLMDVSTSLNRHAVEWGSDR